MHKFIRRFERRTILIFFGSIYAVALAMAIFPPLYLSASGISTLVLGIPFSIFYWLLDFLILLIGLCAFYVVEDIRGELDEELPGQSLKEGE